MAEQTTTSRFLSNSSASRREIQITLRLSVPGDEDADVDVLVEPGSDLGADWIDILAPRLDDGVRGGIGRLGLPVPPEGLRIVVSDPRFDPPLALPANGDEKRRVGDAH